MALPFNIAIDGYSSCGKSTLAKILARKYRMCYIDTGAMYRALTLYCMRSNIICNKIVDMDRLLYDLDSISIDFSFNNKSNKSETILNGKNVEEDIRGFQVSDNVSIVAQIAEVRNKLITLQQKIGLNLNVVMDGRDIGTKVFPKAKLKIFLTASIEIRTQRRYKDLIEKGENITYQEVLDHLVERDAKDVNRKNSPLVQAEDAVLIDNSTLTFTEQNVLIDNLIKNRL